MFVTKQAQPDKIRILLADDHAQVQRQLAARIQREPRFELAGVPVNSTRTWQEVLSKRPDLLLMDPMMRDGLGLATLRQICVQIPQVPAVVLTAFADTTLCIQLREMGVRQVLVKGISYSRLI